MLPEADCLHPRGRRIRLDRPAAQRPTRTSTKPNSRTALSKPISRRPNTLDLPGQRRQRQVLHVHERQSLHY